MTPVVIAYETQYDRSSKAYRTTVVLMAQGMVLFHLLHEFDK